jgi:hypothetical protein
MARPMHSYFQGMQIVTRNRWPLLWYRGAKKARVVRQVIDVVAFAAAAALLSYAILQQR